VSNADNSYNVPPVHLSVPREMIKTNEDSLIFACSICRLALSPEVSSTHPTNLRKCFTLFCPSFGLPDAVGDELGQLCRSLGQGMESFNRRCQDA
jgi:hypothetical protein